MNFSFQFQYVFFLNITGLYFKKKKKFLFLIYFVCNEELNSIKKFNKLTWTLTVDFKFFSSVCDQGSTGN